MVLRRVLSLNLQHLQQLKCVLWVLMCWLYILHRSPLISLIKYINQTHQRWQRIPLYHHPLYVIIYIFTICIIYISYHRIGYDIMLFEIPIYIYIYIQVPGLMFTCVGRCHLGDLGSMAVGVRAGISYMNIYIHNHFSFTL